ncbi:peptidase MA family metallohydrolase [Cryomorphaceae bacterium 1068]|nr:peptidase MA family metallohydrolase [Cryomorphaceae bacterium 1068]
MTKATTSILLLALVFSITGCADKTPENESTAQETQEAGWEVEKRLTKTVDNLSFSFPSEGYAYDKRDIFVKECMDALKENCARIELSEYTDPIKITFLNSREEMEEEVGMAASGWTNTWTREIHIVATDQFSPPIPHELLHMIAMTTWGYPHEDLIWINEGLATTTEDFCNGFTVGEIYRYLLEEDLLLSIDSLTGDFHGQPSIISYHQSAHLVEYLITNHGLQKFEELWKTGFTAFEEIYAISFAQLAEEVKEQTIATYPTPVSIDWEVFQEGCF